MSSEMLTPRQLELYSLFAGKEDVSIEALYGCYYQRAPLAKYKGKAWRMQQALGWPIASLNSRLRLMDMRIVPGQMRRTYRLVNLR